MSSKDVLIPALEHVEPMLSAKLSTTIQSAHVQEDSVEIHSSAATENLMSSNHLRNPRFHVYLHLVDPMLSVEKSMVMSPVLVCQATLGLLPTVDLNVS